jgi:hypothetical protein
MGTHSNGLPFIDDGSGHRRVLACLRDTRQRTHFQAFLEVSNRIPRSQWAEFESPDDYLPVLDQNGHGSCVGHGSCTHFEDCWHQAGNSPRRFSANFLYALVNGGRDEGAVVGDAMDALVQRGICLDATVPEGHVIYERQLPAQAIEEAQRFRLAKGIRLQSFDDVVSAVLLRRGCSIGIDIGQAFEPDAEGVLPPRRGSGGGHCMCVLHGLRNIRGTWHVKTRNSWGTRWGKAGNCWMPESYFQGQDDHFSAISPATDPLESDLPPMGK